MWQFKCGVCWERRDRLRGDGHVIQLRVGRTPDGVPRRRRLKRARPAIIHGLSDRCQGLDDVLCVTHRAFPSTEVSSRWRHIALAQVSDDPIVGCGDGRGRVEQAIHDPECDPKSSPKWCGVTRRSPSLWPRSLPNPALRLRGSAALRQVRSNHPCARMSGLFSVVNGQVSPSIVCRAIFHRHADTAMGSSWANGVAMTRKWRRFPGTVTSLAQLGEFTGRPRRHDIHGSRCRLRGLEWRAAVRRFPGMPFPFLSRGRR